MAVAEWAMSAATDRGAYQDTISIVSNTNRRDVSEQLDLLALADTPFINRIGWGAPSGGTAIEWISENLGPGYCAVLSVKASAGTTVGFTSVYDLTTAETMKQLQAGTILYGYSSTDGEHSLMAIVSVNTDGDIVVETLTTSCTFSVNLSATIGDKWYILGAVVNEGSLPRPGQFRNRQVHTNVFNILRQDVQITGSQKETDFYAINREDQHQILMRMKEMQRERERLALYSVYHSARSSTEASLMNGALGLLLDYATAPSTVDQTTTVFTENAFNTVVSGCWENGAEKLTLFGNIAITSKFTRWDKNRIRTSVNERRGGGMISHYLSESGIEVELVPMRHAPVNIAFVIDTAKCKLRAKKNRKGFMQKLGLNGDFEDWQIISEFSMEGRGFNLGQHGLFTKLSG